MTLISCTLGAVLYTFPYDMHLLTCHKFRWGIDLAAHEAWGSNLVVMALFGGAAGANCLLVSIAVPHHWKAGLEASSRILGLLMVWTLYQRGCDQTVRSSYFMIFAIAATLCLLAWTICCFQSDDTIHDEKKDIVTPNTMDSPAYTLTKPLNHE